MQVKPHRGFFTLTTNCESGLVFLANSWAPEQFYMGRWEEPSDSQQEIGNQTQWLSTQVFCFHLDFSLLHVKCCLPTSSLFSYNVEAIVGEGIFSFYLSRFLTGAL